MKIIYLKSVDSTQNYIKELLKKKKLELPHAVVAKIQTDGVGSRGNYWSSLEGNLFLSFALPLNLLPNDLKLESASIYFAYLLKETLGEFNSATWLKWPNDFYIDNLKIGGMITNIIDDVLICGVGLNLLNSPKEFGILDITIKKELLLEKYFRNVEKKVSWKKVFSKYKLEFYKNQNFFTHKNKLRILLGNAKLQSDGSIISNGERIYSTR